MDFANSSKESCDFKEQLGDEFHLPTKLKRPNSTRITTSLPGAEDEIIRGPSITGQPTVTPGSWIGAAAEPHAVPCSHNEQPQAARQDAPNDRALVVLGPLNPDAFQNSKGTGQVYAKQATTLTEFQQQLNLILTELVGHPRELWLFHALLADEENWPVLSAQYVKENDLYQPLLDTPFESVSVFQLVKRIPQLQCPPISDSPQVTVKKAANLTQTQSWRNGQKPCNCDLQFYLFEFRGQKAPTWPVVYSALADVVLRAQDDPALTTETARSQLTQTCEGLKFTAASGFEVSRRPFPPTIPECLDAEGFEPQIIREGPQLINSAVNLSTHVAQVAASSQEPVPLEALTEEKIQPASQGLNLNEKPHVEEPKQSLAKSNQQRAKTPTILPERPLDDMTQMSPNEHPRSNLCHGKQTTLIESERRRNASIGILIGNYEAKWQPRSGAKNDNELITRISLRFKCHRTNINLLFDADGAVTKADIMTHLDKFVKKYQDSRLDKIFLFISAHGTESGMVTSTGETVQIKELLLPLSQLKTQVILFYQPCRGALEHCAANMIVLGGVSLTSVDTAGCCLPPQMKNCSALYASMPLYASHHADMGSPMLFALYEIVDDLELTGKTIRLVELARRTHYRILALMREVFNVSQQVSFVQYTVREIDCSIEIGDEIIQPKPMVNYLAPETRKAVVMPSFKIRL